MSSDPRVSTEAAVARLSAQVEAIGREISQMRTDNTARLERIEAQTTRTNGTVTAHAMQIHDIEEREKAREDARRKDDDDRDRTFRRMSWAITTAVGILAVAVATLAVIVG